MSKPSKNEIKTRMLEYRIKRTIQLLEAFDVKCSKNILIDDATGAPFLSCAIKLDDGIVKFRFPITKLGRRFEKELARLDRACFCGLVDYKQVKYLFTALSLPPIVHKYRTKLRKATGLVKDRKLRNYLIWRRLHVRDLVKK